MDSCTLADGRRIKYALLKRPGIDAYYVRFRLPGGARTGKSTGETNRKAAAESAVRIINETYTPDQPATAAVVTWKEAEQAITAAMTAANLRTATISDYKRRLADLAAAFPNAKGPAEITEAAAVHYDIKRADKLSPTTQHYDIVAIRSVYGKWLRKAKIVRSNPFDAVELTKLDRRAPRVLTSTETGDLIGWFETKYPGWPLPALAIRLKLLIGCRIGELTALRTDHLADGNRIRFDGDKVKGRADGWATVPSATFKQLTALAGPTFVFETFAESLRAYYIGRNRPQLARHVGPFSPVKFAHWVEARVNAYRQARGILDANDPRYFKPHNLRGTAMSRARAAGVGLTDASVAFRYSPDTMRKHYLEEQTKDIADAVFGALHANKPKRTRNR